MKLKFDKPSAENEIGVLIACEFLIAIILAEVRKGEINALYDEIGCSI